MKKHSHDGLHREITERIIGAGIEVHREMGPGLLESSYEDCLDLEFRDREMIFSRQVVVPLRYKGKPLASMYRLDLIVEQRVIVEIKAVDKLMRVHLAQMLSYLKHTGLHVGLIMNCNCEKFPDGIIRVSL